MKVGSLLDLLDSIAPFSTAEPWDRVGLMVGDPGGLVEKAAVSLDPSPEALAFAAAHGCQALIAHHPLIWNPLKRITHDVPGARALKAAITHDIAVIAFHTNWDFAAGGVNDALAAALKLTDSAGFGPSASHEMLRAVVFCPEGAAQAVIDAMSRAGAGVIGSYERCAFITEGTGTFLAGEASRPAVGERGQITSVRESRIEMVLPAALRRAVEAAVRGAHPYEEPALDFIPLAPRQGSSLGRIGRLPSPLDLSSLVRHVENQLGSACWCWGRAAQSVNRLAVVGGAAGGSWKDAMRAGADAFLTGEIKQDEAAEAAASGFPVIAAGHYATEQPGMAALSARLALLGVECALFVPEPGVGGRPLNKE